MEEDRIIDPYPGGCVAIRFVVGTVLSDIGSKI